MDETLAALTARLDRIEATQQQLLANLAPPPKRSIEVERIFQLLLVSVLVLTVVLLLVFTTRVIPDLLLGITAAATGWLFKSHDDEKVVARTIAAVTTPYWPTATPPPTIPPTVGGPTASGGVG